MFKMIKTKNNYFLKNNKMKQFQIGKNNVIKSSKNKIKKRNQ